MSGATSTTGPDDVQRSGAVENGWRPSRFLAISAWLSFLLNTIIIATGGAVRLTGSGLGCDQWPLCTPGSLVPTPELSYHALIEFGNRTISGPLLIAAVLVVILSWRNRASRQDLHLLSWLVLALVLVQALLGGIIVWFHLNANLVGLHYTISLVLVCLTAAYLARMRTQYGPRTLVVPKAFAILTHVTTLVLAVSVLFGVFTTGSGPHSGDATIQRDGIDASLMSHIHSWPGYALLALTIVLTLWAVTQSLRPAPWFVAVLILQLVQIVVGVYQARNGLPPLAVGVHMVLASLTAATMTVTVLKLKQPVSAQ